MRTASHALPRLLLVILLSGIGGGLARVATSLYAVAIGSTPAQLGLLAACQGLGLVLMSLPSSALVRRHGPAAALAGGSLLGGLACAAVPLVREPRFLIGCFTALAFCMPLRYVATNVVVMERLGREGHGRAGWYRGLQLLGMHLVGPSLAVPIVAALGFPRTWWLVAVAFALPAVAARRGLDGATAPRERAILPALRTAAADPETPLLAVTELTAQGAVTCSAFFLVPVALQRHGLSPPHAAALLGAQAASFVVVLLALGGLASRWDRARLVSIAYGAAGAGLLLVGLARGAAWLWAGGLLLGGGLGLVQMENLIRAARIGARVGQDAASGLQQLAGASGGLATGLLGGLVGKALGPQAIFLLLVPAFAWLARRQLSGASPLHRNAAQDPTPDTEHSWATRPSIPPASPSTIRSAASAASPCSRRPASERCSST